MFANDRRAITQIVSDETVTRGILFHTTEFSLACDQVVTEYMSGREGLLTL